MEIERRDWEFGDDDGGLVVESRADGRSVIKGYAVVYNRLSVDMGGFRERILPGAFDGVLNRQRGRSDLVSYYNHNPDILLGRESSGTLKVWSDDKGVAFEVVPPASRADILELVARRDVKGASFTFSLDKNGEGFTTDENGRAIREIRAATIYELGPVVQPAYPSTSVAVAMRSFQAWLAEEEQRCACQQQNSSRDPVREKLLSARARLLASRLKTFVFPVSSRGFCPTGQGGGIDNSCGKGEGGGGGGQGKDDGGAGGGSGGGSAVGVGNDSGPKDTPAGKQRKERLRDRIEGTQAEADREVNKAKAKEDKVRQKLDQAKKDLKDFKDGKKVAELDAKVKEAESKLAESKQKVAELKKAGDASKARMAELKAKLDALKKRSVADDIEAALEAEDKEAARVLNELKKAVASLDDVMAMIESVA